MGKFLYRRLTRPNMMKKKKIKNGTTNLKGNSQEYYTIGQQDPLFRPSSKNKRKIHRIKRFLYFSKWNFLALILKNFLYFFKRMLFLYFRKWNPVLFSPGSKTKKKKSTPKKIVIFQETKPPQKTEIPEKFLMFQETKNLKSFFYFRK